VKPYLLFAGDNYYPSGGLDDLRGDFDTLEEAKLAALLTAGPDRANRWRDRWWSIVEHATMEEIESGDSHWPKEWLHD
jgi:hypothetical protein